MAVTTTFDGFTPQAFIFDFDGTLADSLHVWVEVDRLFLENHDLPHDDEYNEMIVALGFEAGAAWVVEHFDIDMTPDQIVAEWTDLSRWFYEENVNLNPYVKDYLEALRAEGYPMAIATSLRRDLLEAALTRNGVLDLFDAVSICDELASAGKLEPTVYLDAASKLSDKYGRPIALSDCVVFEDIAIAANTARNEGAYVIGMVQESPVADPGDMAAACDRLIGSFGELMGD